MTIIYFFRFLFVSLKTYLGYLVKSLGKPQNIKRTIQADSLYNFFISMGPMYVKMGQLMATRSDLIPEEWVTKLSTLQDDAPSMPAKEAERWINSLTDYPIDSVFKSIDYQSIASASIAQVHVAHLLNGQKVAIKLIKEDVRSQMKQNLVLVKSLVAVANVVSATARELELKDRFTELSMLLSMQTDLELELKNQLSIKEEFRGHSFVIVPDAYAEYSNKSILVMEFMQGIPGKEASTVDLDAKLLARRFQDSIYTMLYMHGICHGDPHPGNIFFTKDGKIILLDFGITVHLSEDEKWGLSSFYYACTRKEWDVAVTRFTEHFVTQKEKVKENWDVYVKEIAAVLKYHFDESHNQWSTVSYFNDINDVLRRYGAKYTSNFTKVELVFLSCEGFASNIDPNIDIWANARIFTDKYSPYMSDQVKQNFDTHFADLMPSSLALRDEASDYIVAPTHIHRYFFPSTYPVFVDKAEKGYFFDLDKNRYVDLSGGYGPHILGYKHSVVNKALVNSIENGMVNAIGNEAELQLAQKLVDSFPPAEKAVLCNSGTEANLIAIRLARAFTRKNRVAKFEGHYHGWSDQGMVSSWFRFHGSIKKPMPISGTQGTDVNTVNSTSVFQYGDIEGLDRLVAEADEIACVICEPMPSSIAKYDTAFLTKLKSICTDHNIILIFDEVVTGYRVAFGGVQTLAGVVPDLTTVGKIIGGGLPCGAVLGPKNLVDIARSSEDPFSDYDNKAFVGGTMSGNSLTCRAGVATIDHLKENPDIYTSLSTNTGILADELRSTADKYDIDFILEARHSIFSMTFGHKSSPIYRKKQAGSNFKANIALAYYMRKHGVYLPELHSFMLSAAHTEDDLAEVGGAFEKSIVEMRNDGFFIN